MKLFGRDGLVSGLGAEVGCMRPQIFRLFVALMLMAIHSVSSFAASPAPADIMARAEQGNAEAQYSVGLMYQGGRGVPQDLAEAAKWYRKSAEQGYPPAERSLGSMYQGGYGGLAKDDVEARRWLSKAAEQGDSLAKFALFLENTRLAPFVRGLPQGERDVVFFATIGALCLIALAVAALCVFAIWKVLRRFFPDLQIGRILWPIIGALALTYLLRFLPKN
jgi:hypothetical protein